LQINTGLGNFSDIATMAGVAFTDWSWSSLIVDLDKRIIVKQIPLNFSIIKQVKNYFITVAPNIIHTHLGHADLVGLWCAKNINSKVFTTMHSTFFKKNSIDNIFFYLYRRLKNNLGSNWHIISISKSVEKQVLNKIKIHPENSHLLYNAIPSEKVETYKINSINSKNKKIQILFIGRLTKAKSLETLIEAISILRDENISLNIVGDGDLMEKLRDLSKEFEVENLVNFLGESKNVDQYYLDSDIFVLPSIWEGFGIVILEAFRAKLAVIASNIDGPSELIEDYHNGLLFKPKNALELSRKIKYLIDNESKRQEISENGLKTFENKYHIDTYVKQLNDLYKNA
jgi:glycosyltransferase involved in cell wall biosynthesis